MLCIYIYIYICVKLQKMKCHENYIDLELASLMLIMSVYGCCVIPCGMCGVHVADGNS